MSLKIGIVGLPNVGKSTLFQALTKKEVDRSNYPFATIDPNVGVVEVPDSRLEKLAELSHSKKVVRAVVEFVDIAGLVKGASQGEGLGNKFLAHIREVDAILEVVRAFEDEKVIHVNGKPNPASDIETIQIELELKDLETKEKAKDISQLQLLSSKPILYAFNTSDKDNAKIPDIPNSVSLDIKKEFEISELDESDRKELNLASRLPELIQKAYEILGLITFFTTGEDESRAWTIPKDSKAPRAGRAIHADFENKFIRAEVISYEKFLEAGTWSKAREMGLLRTEGKEYIVKDGDIIEFKI
ncbi:redox-regulated ATPase YchF [Candidatus Giovannonibacteria bacterium]|nr:redox-regulated ATPase YchF [Candidatus Giovannonibacteria bacterium]